MADRTSGPVKPPVIDLTARSASARPESRPEPEAHAAPGETAPGMGRQTDAPPPFRMSFAGANWPLLGGAAVAGAVLGTILTYLLATLLPLPSHEQPMPPDLSAAVAAQASRLDTLEAGTTDLQNAGKKTQVSLDATIAQLDGDMTTANKAIADLKASIPTAAPAVDLTPLETELKTLKSQVDAIAAGASGADAGAIAQNIADLETGMTSLTTRLNGVDSTVTALRTDLDATRKTLTDHINAALPNEVGPALKLPLILSGLESAFASGKPFDKELASLRTVVPDMSIDASLAAAAPSGLSRPDQLMQQFETTLPDILAARDTTGNDWASNALDWAKSLLALRPAEEEQGDSPEAVASRLEGAMTRRDYAAASALIAQLPAHMQTAAAPVSTDIATHAAADKLVTDLRTRALSASETAQ